MPKSDIIIFDRQKVRQQRCRALPKLKDHGFLIDWTRDQLLSRLEFIKRDFADVLQIGSRTELKKENISGAQNYFITDNIKPNTISENFVLSEEELLPFKKSAFDLVISALNLHTVNDLPGALSQIKSCLKPDGLFLIGMFGGETLYELRDVMTKAELEISGGLHPRVAPFADKPEMGSLMQRAGFNLPVIDSEIVTVTYDNLFKLMHDLRYMGESNALVERSKSMNNKALLMKAAQLYQELYSEKDGRIKATFEIIFLTGWSPHDSQQKPLKPGSAEQRLADALNTEEISANEKAG